MTPATEEKIVEFPELDRYPFNSRERDVWRIATYRKTIEQNPWIPVDVKERGLNNNPKQRQFLLYTDLFEVLYGGAAAGGKQLRLDEPVPTPTGWTTIGSLSVGDELFDETGKICRVTNLFPVDPNPECYRLVFDDGTEIEACADHQWKTFDAKELSQLTRLDPIWRAKRREKRPSRATGKRSALFTASISARNSQSASPKVARPECTVRTTREIAESVRTWKGRANHAIAVTDALELPDAKLLLDPYLLGVWLGDGSTGAGAITSADEEMFEPFLKAGFQPGTRSQKTNNKAVTHSFLGLRGVLKTIGVFENKHLPQIYLRGSRAQRLAILQGLMDTDGTVCDSGSVEFTNTNKRIVDGVYELIVSLGWKARIVESRATLYGVDCGPKWDIKWTPSDYVFKLERKRSKQKLSTRRTTRFRYIMDCQKSEPSPMRCLSVDSPSRLFLVSRSMVPTHNSYATLIAATQFVDVPGYSALLLRESFPALSKAGAWMDIAQEWWGGGKSGAKWNERDHRWRFPSGATIEFGYLDSDKAVRQYDGPSFQYIAIDELTMHTEWRYKFMFKPLRKPLNGPIAKVPLRMRAATNPGGPGHDFVKKRWALGNSPKEHRHPTALFVPAKLADNKGNLDVEGYKKSSLAELDEVTRQQKEFGNWDAVPGGRFKPEWLMKTWAYDTSWPTRSGKSDYILLSDGERCRHDRCATFQTYDPSASASDAADHFVISTWKITPEAKLVWWDCYRDKKEIPEQLKIAQSLYRQHRPQFIGIEEVLNQRAHAQLLRQSTNPMMVVKGVSPMGKDKLTRALGAINLAASGRIYLPEYNPLFPLEDVKSELICFTGLTDKEQSDIVDTLSYACQLLPMVRGGLSHEGSGSAPGLWTSKAQPWDGLR